MRLFVGFVMQGHILKVHVWSTHSQNLRSIWAVIILKLEENEIWVMVHKEHNPDEYHGKCFAQANKFASEYYFVVQS